VHPQRDDLIEDVDEQSLKLQPAAFPALPMSLPQAASSNESPDGAQNIRACGPRPSPLSAAMAETASRSQQLPALGSMPNQWRRLRKPLACAAAVGQASDTASGDGVAALCTQQADCSSVHPQRDDLIEDVDEQSLKLQPAAFPALPMSLPQAASSNESPDGAQNIRACGPRLSPLSAPMPETASRSQRLPALGLSMGTFKKRTSPQTLPQASVPQARLGCSSLATAHPIGFPLDVPSGHLSPPSLELSPDDLPAPPPRKRFRLTCKSRMEVLPTCSSSPLEARRNHGANIAVTNKRRAWIKKLIWPERAKNVWRTVGLLASHDVERTHALQSKRKLPHPMVPGPGKYGNAQNEVLWDWYVNQGRREVHPNAWKVSTCQSVVPRGQGKHRGAAAPFASRASVPGGLTARRDLVVTATLGSVKCRLYIPAQLWRLFDLDVEGQPRLRPPLAGQAPFPVLMPSSGRSAVDVESGFLDLTDTMRGDHGELLSYVQIVAVKPSEVEKYRMSAPFFVVMELPRTPTVQHRLYGEMRPEDLGVGCARHWLVRVADALGADYAFMLDDTVKQWKSVTFNKLDSGKPVLKPAPLGWALTFLQRKASEMETDRKPFSVLGFPRHSRFFDINYKQASVQLSHVYSSFLLNIRRLHREQGLNYRQDVFVWEDIELNTRTVEVWQCNEIVSFKGHFRTGGCSQYVARPYVSKIT